MRVASENGLFVQPKTQLTSNAVKTRDCLERVTHGQIHFLIIIEISLKFLDTMEKNCKVLYLFGEITPLCMYRSYMVAIGEIAGCTVENHMIQVIGAIHKVQKQTTITAAIPMMIVNPSNPLAKDHVRDD